MVVTVTASLAHLESGVRTAGPSVPDLRVHTSDPEASRGLGQTCSASPLHSRQARENRRQQLLG